MKPKRYGIIGWPVEHSVSPRMQTAAFAALNMDATYDLIPVSPEELAEKIHELVRTGYKGWNITVPHKRAIVPLLDDIESTAKISGSINTVVNRNGVLSGYSTDGYGLEMSILEAFKLRVKGNTFLFWGTGGAAVAASAHFVSSGADRIFLVNRTAEKAYKLKDTLLTIRKGVTVEIFRPDDIDSLKKTFEIADVVIQSTSVGLRSADEQSIPTELLVPQLRVVEMIYSGTMLMKAAEARGCDIVDGRAMLLHQGAKSFALWTGLDAPLEIMRKALNREL